MLVPVVLVVVLLLMFGVFHAMQSQAEQRYLQNQKDIWEAESERRKRNNEPPLPPPPLAF